MAQENGVVWAGRWKLERTRESKIVINPHWHVKFLDLEIFFIILGYVSVSYED